jgi:hypothetical protein
MTCCVSRVQTSRPQPNWKDVGLDSNSTGRAGDFRIAGVILNQLGGRRHESKLRAVIEHYTDVPVIGAIQDDARLALVERHLGLMPANETRAAERHVADIAAVVRESVDLDRLLAITRTDVALPPPAPQLIASEAPVRIAVAQDAAFGFYYADDFDALRYAGAELVPFDTLRDPHLPACDGLFIGGGFPDYFRIITLWVITENGQLESVLSFRLGVARTRHAACLCQRRQNITNERQRRSTLSIAWLARRCKFL